MTDVPRDDPDAIEPGKPCIGWNAEPATEAVRHGHDHPDDLR
jgi:hypothetical protein